jgi:hypothetical protein
MKTAKSHLYLLILFLTVLLIAACGGGGGGDDADFDDTISTTGVSITSSNAELIAAKVLTSVNTVQGMTEPVTVLTGVSVDVADTTLRYSDLALWLLEQNLESANQSTLETLTGIVVDRTVSCENGGTYTISGDISNPEVPSVGDSLTYTFYNCEILSLVMNGTMGFTITELSGTLSLSPPYTVGLDAFMNDFSMDNGSVVVTGDGDMSMTLSEDTSGNETLLIAGTSYTQSVNGVYETLTGYRYDLRMDNLSGDFSFDQSGTYESDEIGGSVSYETLTTFSGNDSIANGNPTAGVLHVTTSIDSSQALVTAQPDGINVQIDVDHDGDGLYETTIMTTWTELISL